MQAVWGGNNILSNLAEVQPEHCKYSVRIIELHSLVANLVNCRKRLSGFSRDQIPILIWIWRQCRLAFSLGGWSQKHHEDVNIGGLYNLHS